jgi:hypothetical protein
MKITPLAKTGNSAKFEVVLTKQRGEFLISLSYTLCHLVWKLDGVDAELSAATQMAEAIVSRHDPKQPFKEKYIFGDHNTETTLDATVQYLRRTRI